MPSDRAARQTSARSPDGSAAASTTSRRVSAGKAASRRSKARPAWPVGDTARGSPNPPASWAGLSPSGSSSSAVGFPPVSATIRSLTCSSSGPASAESSSALASSSGSPSTSSSGSPASSAPGARVANTSPTGLAPSRRAANPSAWAEAWSSHCSSSIRQIRGRSPATSDSRFSAARPTMNRSGGGPATRPNAVRSASCCGNGSRSARSSIGAHSWCSPANASSISDWTPAARAT